MTPTASGRIADGSHSPGYAEPSRRQEIVHLSGGSATIHEVALAEEVPVALVYNGRPHAVMMATPADLEDFAVGFSLGEEIVASASEISRVAVVRAARGIELQMTVASEVSDRLADRTRRLSGRTGCGLCGVEAIDEAVRAVRPVVSDLRVKPAALWRAGAALGERQPLNDATRTVHGAAWASPDGELRVVREDVGRHNAVDKVIGALARAGTNANEGFLVVTSRASYELVQKAAVAGIPLLAAVSRPTGLAIRMAEAANVALVALLRGESANLYAGASRVLPNI